MEHIFTRFLAFAALVAAAFHVAPVRAQDAAAYVIADNETGYVLESRNADKKLAVASLTKIATACVVLDWAELGSRNLSELATVSASPAALAGPNPIGLQPGDQISLRDALYAALLQSDNIAAETLANHAGLALQQASGDRSRLPVEAFVVQMNALARKLGMDRTLFRNPHGLDNGNRPPYSTARDMARLTRYSVGKALFRGYVAQKEREISFLRAGQANGYLLKNTNELLGSEGIDGVKTGRTTRAGECVIITASRTSEIRQEGTTTHVTPRRLVVVVLGATNRFEAASALLARGWQSYDQWASAGRRITRQ